MPNENQANDESTLQNRKYLNQAKKRIYEKLAGVSEKTGWDFKILELFYTESPQYLFIARGQIEWDIAGEKILSVELVCEDHLNRQGYYSAVKESHTKARGWFGG